MTTEPQADIVERLLLPWFTNGCEAYQREAAAEITRLRAQLAEAELRGVKAGLEAWNHWYDRATADDDCEYLNGAGWDDAAKLRAIDPTTLTAGDEHG